MNEITNLMSSYKGVSSQEFNAGIQRIEALLKKQIGLLESIAESLDNMTSFPD